MKILGDIQWLIAVGVVCVFGMFPLYLQILRIRLYIKKDYLTKEGDEVALTLIRRLYLYLFFAAIFEVLMVIGYFNGKNFEIMFWLFVIILTAFLSDRSVRIVDPVMINLTKQKKCEFEYKNSVFDNSEWKYDIFISYRTKDSDFVRQIAEQLIGSGIKVWFFEYKVLLDAWEKLKPKNWEGLESVLEKAIKKSEFGLAFTNDLYAESDWCKFEMTQLLDSCGPGIQKVIEVKNHEQVGGLLKEFPELELDGRPSRTLDDPNDILSFIGEITKRPIHDISIERPKGIPHVFEGKCMGKTYQLDISEWQVVKYGGTPEPLPELLQNVEGLPEGLQNVAGPHFRRNMGNDKVEMNLYFGPELSRKAIRESEDDREMYYQLIEYASDHFENLRSELHVTPTDHGVHLVHVGDYAQIALTYWMHGYWTRKYSVIIFHSESGDAVEFVFTFGFSGPSSSFQRFCRYGYIMDNLVKSLKWPVQIGNVFAV